MSDARIRIGQLQEFGKGTERNAPAALKSYAAAVRSGNFFALAYLAELCREALISRRLTPSGNVFSQHSKLMLIPVSHARAVVSLHDYIATQLRLGSTRGTKKCSIATVSKSSAHHQQMLQHPFDESLRHGGRGEVPPAAFRAVVQIGLSGLQPSTIRAQNADLTFGWAGLEVRRPGLS